MSPAPLNKPMDEAGSTTKLSHTFWLMSHLEDLIFHNENDKDILIIIDR